MTAKKSTFLLTLAAYIVFSAPTAFAADGYKVSAKIEQGGSVVGEPILMVKAGAPANVSVHGQNRYSLMVTIVPREQDEVEVSVKADTTNGSVSSVVITKAGRPMTIASGEVGLSLTVDDMAAGN